MNDNGNNSSTILEFENLLKTPKSVETEAGKVEFLSVSEAIAADKYKKKLAAKRPLVRVQVAKHREF